MDVLDLAESKLVFSAHVSSTDPDSDGVGRFLASNGSGRIFRIGTPRFSALSTAMARDAERNIVLACSTFAHSLEGTMKGTVPWAGIGFYYTSFFAAKAIMLASGVWFEKRNCWIDVNRSSRGEIGLQINRAKHPTVITGRGSHKDFWRFYQLLGTRIAPDVDPNWQWAVIPSITDIDTLHDLRLQLNYDPHVGMESAIDYPDMYADGEFEKWISGRAATLYEYAQAYLAYAVHRSADIALDTEVFNGKFAGRAEFVKTQLNWARNRNVELDITKKFV